VAVVAEGRESGGPVGELTTWRWCLSRGRVDFPVIAAGGIAWTGHSHALMLGAVGIQMGTRFLVARECRVHRTTRTYFKSP
jgi:enoyl-[acyl-carrier protein] reductase II